MRISCPSCGANYEVPEAKLAPGRQVRCVKCDTMWAPLPLPREPEPLPLPVAPPVPAREPVERLAPERLERLAPEEPEFEPAEVPRPVPVVEALPEPPVPVELREVPVAEPVAVAAAGRRGRLALGAGWLVSLLVVLALVLGAVLFRAQLMHVWPPSARAFGWLGLSG